MAARRTGADRPAVDTGVRPYLKFSPASVSFSIIGTFTRTPRDIALIARNILGIAVLLLIAFIFSTNRRAIRLRTVIAALLAQIGIGAFILFVPIGKTVLAAAASG